MTNTIFINCCNEKPVINLPSGERLCRSHFINYFESKAYKTIKQFSLLGREENLGVALSGGKDSLTVLSILSSISKRNQKIKITAIAIDEGIKGYREKTLGDAIEFCNKNNIDIKIFSYKENFGLTLDEMLKILDVKPCSICGVFRRYLLNKKSRELGLTKIATGHNLDDECQSIMMNQFRNRARESARLGPISGAVDDRMFVSRIKPLYLCTEREVATYAFLNNFMSGFNECPNARLSYRARIRNILNGLENSFPGTKYSIVNSFLYILPELKKKFSNGSVQSCARCSEPCSNDICNACHYLEKIQLVLSRKGI